MLREMLLIWICRRLQMFFSISRKTVQRFLFVRRVQNRKIKFYIEVKGEMVARNATPVLMLKQKKSGGGT